MVVCGVYLRETRQPLTHKDSVVVYQIVVSYLLYIWWADAQNKTCLHLSNTLHRKVVCGAGSC